MLKYNFLVYFLCFFMLFANIPSSAMADGYSGSLERAVEKVKRRTNGKILSVNTRREGTREVHNVRVLTKKGRVKRFRVDARDGQFINSQQGRHAPPRHRR